MSRPPITVPPADNDPPLLDRRSVRRAFGRAASSYDEAAVLHREVGARMGQRLALVRLDGRRLLDAGCGTGASLAALRQRFPGASLIALDSAFPMLAEARHRGSPTDSWLSALLGRSRGSEPPVRWVGGDIEALPLASRSIDLIWSNLALQWCSDPARAFEEFARVLRIGGLLMFSTLGPDTLKELRAAFAIADGLPHVHRFIDLHDLGDLLVARGFADPVMDMEMITVDYGSTASLYRDLRSTGAVNAATGRLRGLMGKERWARMDAALGAVSGKGAIPITWEIVYGHAWKAQPRTTPDGHSIVRVHPRSVR